MPEVVSWKDILEYKEGTLYWKVSFRNNLVKKGDALSGSSNGNYYKFGYKYNTYLVHRVVWELHNGTIPERKCIDHINGIKTDNRIENLRIVSHAENARNRKVHRDNGTIRPFFDSRVNKYRASLNLGSFESKEEAQRVLNEAYSLIRRNVCHVSL